MEIRLQDYPTYSEYLKARNAIGDRAAKLNYSPDPIGAIGSVAKWAWSKRPRIALFPQQKKTQSALPSPVLSLTAVASKPTTSTGFVPTAQPMSTLSGLGSALAPPATRFAEPVQSLNPQASFGSVPMFGGELQMGLGGTQEVMNPTTPSSLFQTIPSTVSLDGIGGINTGGLTTGGFVSDRPAPTIPIDSSPLSFGINQPTSAIQEGRAPIPTPHGTLWATPQQASNYSRPRLVDERGTRTPEQQQALIATASEDARNRADKRAEDMQAFFAKSQADRRAGGQSQSSYTSPSGLSMGAPTNMYGKPIKAWEDMLEKQGRLKRPAQPEQKVA